jgi:predicted transcriptional regulator
MNEDTELQKRGRGRPPGVELSEEVRVRLTPDQRGLLDRLAARHGLSRAAVMRTAMLDWGRRERDDD